MRLSTDDPGALRLEARPTRTVPFSRPTTSVEGTAQVAAAAAQGELKARGRYTFGAEAALSDLLGGACVTLVQSCTAALELAALLLDVGPGDEVILPSFGFASSANAFVLRGATPVFADIVPGTLNLDPAATAAAVTDRTRAILVVHYAGVAADLDRLGAIAAEAGVPLIEDAAQGIGAAHRGRPLGTIGALGTISFDATKNITCGSGGALIVNDPSLVPRAEALRDYGTDRSRFTRGEVGRYRWIEAGSNLAINELAAAYLLPQIEAVAAVTADRVAIWDRYHRAFADAEAAGRLTRPVVPAGCAHNGHIYALLMPDAATRTAMLSALLERGIEATFHYVPLHSAPAGRRYGRSHGTLRRTDDLSARLLRLPLFDGIEEADADAVIDAVLDLLPHGPG